MTEQTLSEAISAEIASLVDKLDALAGDDSLLIQAAAKVALRELAWASVRKLEVSTHSLIEFFEESLCPALAQNPR